MSRAFLIAGGDVDIAFLRSYLEKRVAEDIVIAIDKGFYYFEKANIVPDFIIGDFDSMDEKLLLQYSENSDIKIIRHNPIKDKTDTELAIELAEESGCKEIEIIGAFGGRMDHQISNVFLCFKSSKSKVCLLDESNKMYGIHAVDGEHRIYKKEQWGKYISFFPLFGIIHDLCVEGVKYPLHNKEIDVKKEPTLTISNEIIEEYASIRFGDSSLLIVESRDRT